MKKGLIIGIILIAVVVIGYFVFSPNQSVNKEELVRIGAVLPLSGDVASYGTDSRDGINLATELANNKQDKYLFEVYYEDSKGEPKTAVTSLEKLIATKDPTAFIGENISSSTSAMIPIIDKNKVILISPSASAPNLSGMSRYFFRVFPSDVEEGAFIAKTVYDNNPSGKVIVLYVNNDYGLGLKDIFEKKSKELGLNVLESFGFSKGTTDFKSILPKAKSLDPDVIYLPSYYEEGGALVKQIKEFGISADLYGSTTHEDPKFIQIAGNASEGFIFPVSTGYNSNSKEEVVNNFIRDFKLKFNKEPGLVSALAYDCANLIINGIIMNGNSSDGIRKFLLNTKNIQGAAGNMNFDESGDVHKPIILKSVVNGSFKELNNGN